MKPTFIGFIILLSSVFLLASCSSKTSDNSNVPNQNTNNNAQNMGIVAGKLEPSIKSTVNGNDVSFSFVVKNQTERVQDVSFSSSETYAFTVNDEKGETVYNSSEGKMHTTMMSDLSLKQAEEVEYNDKVEDLAPGKYTVEFTWKAMKQKVSTSAAFTIE